MGLRSFAPNVLENAFSSAFSTYLANDPLWSKTALADGTPDPSPVFVSGMAWQPKSYPQVIFKCVDCPGAANVGSGIYSGELSIQIFSELSEVQDDYEALFNMHLARTEKVQALLDATSPGAETPDILLGLLNKPATGTDRRTIRNINVSGYTTPSKVLPGKDANRFISILDITVGFQTTSA